MITEPTGRPGAGTCSPRAVTVRSWPVTSSPAPAPGLLRHRFDLLDRVPVRVERTGALVYGPEGNAVR